MRSTCVSMLASFSRYRAAEIMPGRLILSTFSFLRPICDIHVACSSTHPQRAAWRLFRPQVLGSSAWQRGVPVGRINKLPECRPVRRSLYPSHVFSVAFMWMGPEGQSNRPLHPQ